MAEFAGLELLLNATDKAAVARILDDAFACRLDGWTRDRRKRVAQELSLQSEQQVDELFASCRHVVKEALYSNPTTAEELDAVFPPNFHKQLRGLLIKVIGAQLAGWRESAITSQV